MVLKKSKNVRIIVNISQIKKFNWNIWASKMYDYLNLQCYNILNDNYKGFSLKGIRSRLWFS